MLARMLRLTSLLCLLPLLAIAIHAQEKPLTLGPALLSFPQIASRMSIPGHTVECSGALRQRAAFVALKEREWSVACHLLETGLDVRFREKQEGKGVWVMEADPEITTREQTWRSRLATALYQKISAQTEKVAPLLHVPYHSFFQRQMQVAVELEEREKKDPEHKDLRAKQLKEEMDRGQDFVMPTAFVNMVTLRNTRLLDVRRAVEISEGYSLLDARRFMDVNRVVRTLDAYLAREEEKEREKARKIEQQSGEIAVDADLGYGTFRKILEEVNGGNYSVWKRLRFEPQDATLHAQLEMFVDGESLLHDDQSVELDASRSVDAIFEAAGTEAKEWRTGEKTATATFLKGDRAKQRFQVNRGRLTMALSQAIESWQVAGGKDVIMELAPLREELSLPADEENDEETGFHRDAIKETCLQDILTEEHLPTYQTWTFREQEGTLLVKSQLAFLNRTRSYPLPAFLALDRRWPAKPTTLPIADIRNYQQSVNAQQNASFSGFNLYRGLPVGLIAQSRPFTILLDRLSEADRKRLLQAASTSPTSIPLLTFGKQPVLDVALALREIALDSGGLSESLLPGFANTLAASVLRIESTTDEEGNQSLHLILLRSGRDMKETEKTYSDLILGGGRL